jgi:hypothetical protein
MHCNGNNNVEERALEAWVSIGEAFPIALPLFGGDILVSIGSFVEVAINISLLVTQVSQKEDLASKSIGVNIYRSVDGSDLEASIPCLSAGMAHHQDTAEVFQRDEYHDIHCVVT